MRTLFRSLAVSAVLLVGGACDSGGGGGPDLARYCELVDDLDAAGDAAFSKLGDNPSDDEVKAAAGGFVDAHRDEIEEVRDVAPEEIRDEVEELTEANLRIAEEGQAAFEGTEDADAKISEFEDANCDKNNTDSEE